MDSTYPLVPIANFLACILVLSSMSRSMLQPRSIGVCSFAIWVVITSFMIGLNSTMWANTVENLAPVWCDIVARLEVGSLAGIPAASLVIIRRLSLALRLWQHDRSLVKTEKLDLLVDICLCLGTPLVSMALSYIVQTARFVIIEEYGCTGASVAAGLTIVINSFVPVVFPIVSLTMYSPRLIWTYFKRRNELDGFLSDSYLGYKFLALGLFDILITFPIALTFLFETIFQDREETRIFWPGWKATHSSISSVPTATWAEWKSIGWAAVASVRTGQWTNPLFAVIFFALFGLSEKRTLWYRNLYWKVMEPFGFTHRRDLEASTIAFESGSVQGSGANGVPSATTNNHSPGPNTDGRSFNDATDMEEARNESFGAQTMVVSPSLSKVDSKGAWR